MSFEELIAWAEGKVLFTSMYNAENEGFEHQPHLNDVEVGQDNLVPWQSDMENEGNSMAMDNIQVDLVDSEVLARQKKLDKGKAVMTKDDSVKTNKRKNVRRGNGISIRENEHPLSPNSESDSDSEENIDKYDNIVSDTDTDESDRSFDYLSDCEDEVIELRKRKFDYRKGAVEVGEENESTETDKDVEGNGDLNGFGSTPLVRQHEKYMEWE
ncbi:hypothetical protein CTI12_AA416890 [Artemisia annua]|uniref:Uncharacterized protein n=1 Tax=Artemisia annua TaxID=35608 RepID=A0A2U1M524_ARTAN|nr:hypothetical protein CTI12_AA416890 [Artemisia annua]